MQRLKVQYEVKRSADIEKIIFFLEIYFSTLHLALRILQENKSSVRMLLPKEIWTKTAEVFYMARNPKDAMISRYHMARNHFRWNFSMEEIFQLTINDETLFAPLPEHVLSFWQLRNLDHVLFLTYEELSADRFAGCKKTSQFLGYNYDDVKLQELADLVEFKSMKERMIDPTKTLVGEDPNYRLITLLLDYIMKCFLKMLFSIQPLSQGTSWRISKRNDPRMD